MKRLLGWVRRIPFPVMMWLGWLASIGLFWAVAQSVHGGAWPILPMLNRWDAQWYASIVQFGYAQGAATGQANLVFFPLYPLLVSLLGWVVRAPILVLGVVVSATCFLGALALLHDLVRRRYDARAARWATVLMAFSPFGLFFGLMYTESLFLLTAVGAFWCLQRRWWWGAAAMAGLASATRSVGVAVSLVVVGTWIYEHRAELRAGGRQMWRLAGELVPVGLLSIGGLLAFAGFLQLHNHDALAFVHAQQYYGRSGVHNLPPEFSNFSHNIVRDPAARALQFSYGVWYASLVVGLVGAALLARRREYGYAAFVALGLLIPLASGTVGAMNRYLTVLFPLFVLVALLLKGRERWWAAALSWLSFGFFWLMYLDPRLWFFG